MISLVPDNVIQVIQQFIDKHLARAGVSAHRRAVFNYLDTMIAMVEAGEAHRLRNETFAKSERTQCREGS
jgi:hypothetical protein